MRECISRTGQEHNIYILNDYYNDFLTPRTRTHIWHMGSVLCDHKVPKYADDGSATRESFPPRSHLKHRHGAHRPYSTYVAPPKIYIAGGTQRARAREIHIT